MNRYVRTDRVAPLLQREISQIIEHELLNERMAMTTVTGVEVTKDFKFAKVFVSVLGEKEIIDETIDALTGAASFIRSRLAGRIILRNIPALTFHYDSSTVNGIHINKLLDEINKRQS